MKSITKMISLLSIICMILTIQVEVDTLTLLQKQQNFQNSLQKANTSYIKNMKKKEKIEEEKKKYEKLKEEKKKEEEKQRVEEERRKKIKLQNRFRNPIPSGGWCINTHYGEVDYLHPGAGHDGIDFGCDVFGKDAYPIHKGTVIFSQNAGILPGCGEWVAIYHEDLDFSSVYCHLAYRNVSVGDYLYPDDPIGRIGTTGYSTGTHLHLGFYSGKSIYIGNDFNPSNFMKSKGIL